MARKLSEALRELGHDDHQANRVTPRYDPNVNDMNKPINLGYEEDADDFYDEPTPLDQEEADNFFRNVEEDDSPPPPQGHKSGGYIIPAGEMPVIQQAALSAALKGLQDQINAQAILVGRISEILQRYMESMKENSDAQMKRITELEDYVNGMARVVGAYQQILQSQEESVATATQAYYMLGQAVVQSLEGLKIEKVDVEEPTN